MSEAAVAAGDTDLGNTTVADVSPFLDLVVPHDGSSLDQDELAPRFARQLHQAFSIDTDTALGVCRKVLSIGPNARVRDLIQAVAPLGPHPGWPYFGERSPERFLRFLCTTGSESRQAMLNGIPSMPLFSLPKSASSYSSAVLADVMGVRTGIVSLWHLTAYRPWVQYAANFPIPDHDHMPPHALNIGELVAAGINRVVVQVRDPRQLIVSQIRHSQEFGGNTDISDASIEAVSRDYAAWIAGWRVVAPAHGISVHLVRFEDVVAHGRKSFDAILDFFNAPPLLHDNLRSALERAEAQRSAGGLNYRKGRSDEWKETLTPTQIGRITSACGPAFDGLYVFSGSESGAATGQGSVSLSPTVQERSRGDEDEPHPRPVELGPVAIEFYRNLAEDLAAKARPVEAIAILRWLLAQGVQDAAAQQRLWELLLYAADLDGNERVSPANVADANGGSIAAGEILEGAAAAGVGDPGFYGRLGHSLLRQGDLERAAAAFRRAAELDPAAVDYKFALAEMLEQLGRRDEVAAMLAKWAVETDDFSVHARRGHLLVRIGELSGAAAAYRRACEMDPSATDLKIALAGVLELTGDQIEAVEIVQEVAAAAGNDAGLYGRLGQLLIRHGDRDRAASALRRAVALDPTSLDWRRTLADVLDANGRTGEAIEIVQDALSQWSSDAQLHALLGKLMIRSGDLARAEVALRAAIAIDPGPVGVQSSLSDVLAATGRPFEAAEILTQLVARGVRDSEVYARLAQQLHRCGELDAAERALRTAIELGADDRLL